MKCSICECEGKKKCVPCLCHLPKCLDCKGTGAVAGNGSYDGFNAGSVPCLACNGSDVRIANKHVVRHVKRESLKKIFDYINKKKMKGSRHVE